ncbi:hypothetical protein CAMRE0001_2488 [Campylobacter rectus RM3267]|uniref:Uncharacterized protein n=1 Tax=Campylobacter rectus RM3267 TaxID=553218 RepID=B9D5C4_CAMRE|nr:hypothetical protein CAMRE0001_2488 [Campylobacter rectus RM3267]
MQIQAKLKRRLNKIYTKPPSNLKLRILLCGSNLNKFRIAKCS